MLVMGTRPEVIKMFPIVKELRDRGLNVIVCMTGQHEEMTSSLVTLFKLDPDINLKVMKTAQGLNALAERLQARLAKAVAEVKPDWLLVQGDTTSALMAALVAFHENVAVAHVEAGLRTYIRDSPFPEEMNRRLISSLASLHFAPTQHSYDHLRGEGLPRETLHITGNTGIDALQWVAAMDTSPEVQTLLDTILVTPVENGNAAKPRVLLVTTHRRENLGEPMIHICKAVKRLVTDVKDVVVVFPVHLNPAVQKIVKEHLEGVPRVLLIKPLSYEFFAKLLNITTLVMTDSGGIQEEVTAFSVPALVLRRDTERP
ncbi:hypothetical protein HKX48_006374 [Thoreauomyces humboldtii]|nr:hypothetical protein HKX48_006374 [Thoreauomyces humboldtii]